MIIKIRRILTRILTILIVIVAILLLTINLPFNFFIKKTTIEDYSDWMYETLPTDKRIIDVAMLGAHDAFTNKIAYASEIDFTTAAAIQTGIPGALIKGFSVKQSKTQVSDVTEMLENGVRYFDIRLTHHAKADVWFTAHTYFSNEFIDVLTDMKLFLSDHPGEFLILDIQHVNGIEYDDLARFDEIKSLFDLSGVLDYAYEEGSKDLKDITYGDITANQTQAGVLVLSKFEESDASFWNYDESIRSAWANTDNAETLYDFLSNESALIDSGEALMNDPLIDSRTGFRVMQAVLTMQMDGDGIIEGLKSWSLLAKARTFNPELITQADFPAWLVSMPIVMVDYSDSNFQSFNDDIMAIIIDFNKNIDI